MLFFLMQAKLYCVNSLTEARESCPDQRGFLPLEEHGLGGDAGHEATVARGRAEHHLGRRECTLLTRVTEL